MKLNPLSTLITTSIFLLFLTSCSSINYAVQEKVGIHKRDIMVSRVENARDSQTAAQEQFTSALDQFQSVVKLEETDLKKAYDSLNNEYEKSVKAADDVSSRIDSVEDVSEDLFKEWKQELKQYDNKDLKKASEQQMKATRANYEQMIAKMKEAEASMKPVLKLFADNVLFLKHNLNAQAIGSLEGEFANLELEIGALIESMNEAINSSNAFIKSMK